VIDEKDIAKALQRPGALPALLTSLGVFAFLLAQNIVYRVIGGARDAFYGGGLGGPDFGSIWATEVALAFGVPLFFAVGVFLSLWQVAPVAGGLRLAHVVTRAALAAAIGAAFVWVARFILGVIVVATTAELRRDLAARVGGVSFDALMDALSTFVGLLPLVVLAAVFLWGWLQRHPPKTAPRGTLDEV
jgi:hypothetical protein